MNHVKVRNDAITTLHSPPGCRNPIVVSPNISSGEILSAEEIISERANNRGFCWFMKPSMNLGLRHHQANKWLCFRDRDLKTNVDVDVASN